LGISTTRNASNYTPDTESVNDFFVTNPTNVFTHLSDFLLGFCWTQAALHEKYVYREDLSRKGAKAQSATAFIKGFLCAFAPLRENTLFLERPLNAFEYFSCKAGSSLPRLRRPRGQGLDNGISRLVVGVVIDVELHHTAFGSLAGFPRGQCQGLR
jgi:hypothetical protein